VQEKLPVTTNEVEITQRMVGANPTFDRRIVGLLKRVPFVNNHLLIASYNFLLRKAIRNHYWATTYFGARLRCTFRDYLQARILHFGFWEPNISSLIETILVRGDVFIDIGANIGYHSLLASKLVGAEGSVIAIEASPSTFQILSAHINENKATNVRIINKAAADAPGRVTLYRAAPGNLGTATTIKSRGQTEEAVIESSPIDHILTSEERSRIRLIKMDIEGAELPVLRRFVQTVNLYPVDISLIVEVSTWEDPDGWSDVFAQLQSRGFRAYLIENDYRYDAYSNWRAPAPLQLLTDVPLGKSDVLFARELRNSAVQL
jgi:FkbM family methyltransferase